MIFQQIITLPIHKISSLVFAVFFGIGILFFSPISAYAEDTTYYIPVQGYYLGANGLPIGMDWICSDGSCMPAGAYESALSRGAPTGMTNPRYASCTSAYCQYYGSDYPYMSYVPDIQTIYAGYRNSQPHFTYTQYPYPTYGGSGSTYPIPYYVSDSVGAPTYPTYGTVSTTGRTTTSPVGTNGFILTSDTGSARSGNNMHNGFIMSGN